MSDQPIMIMQHLIDMFGKVFVIGDNISYAVNQHRTPIIKIGEVLEMFQEKRYYGYVTYIKVKNAETGRTSNIEYYDDRVIKI